MAGGTVNRTLLSTFYQNAGDIYDDNKTEGAFSVLADQTDENWLSNAAHKSASILDHPDGSVTTVKLAPDAVVNSKVSQNAAIDVSKLADGSVSNVRLQYINSLKSNAQNQLNARQPLSEKNTANGYAGLDILAKLLTSQLPDSILGQLQYQGTWNATANTPVLASASASKNYFYVVAVAGTYLTIAYGPGDFIISNGVAWEKIDNSGAKVYADNMLNGVIGQTVFPLPLPSNVLVVTAPFELITTNNGNYVYM